MSNIPATAQTKIPAQIRSIELDGTIYEVASNYVGNITLLELFKFMLKRDIEKSEN